MKYATGVDEAGRAAGRRPPPAKNFTIGIDEVGRGSLAGPVTVAAVAIPKGLRFRAASARLGKLRDSKKLTRRKREEWSEFLCSHPRLGYSIARVYPRQIEKRNISNAANLAASRAFRRLLRDCRLSPARPACAPAKRAACRIFLDGGLYLGNGKWKMENGKLMNARTVVRGDEKIKAIAAASIIAKVSRDRAMTRLAKKYPQYGFEVHKGYGTKAHMRAIKKNGPSEMHRKTFV